MKLAILADPHILATLVFIFLILLSNSVLMKGPYIGQLVSQGLLELLEATKLKLINKHTALGGSVGCLS